MHVAGEEALGLGLLMGTENMTPKEEETEVFSFPHLMLQEFLASLYLSQLPKVQNLTYYQNLEKHTQCKALLIVGP